MELRGGGHTDPLGGREHRQLLLLDRPVLGVGQRLYTEYPKLEFNLANFSTTLTIWDYSLSQKNYQIYLRWSLIVRYRYLMWASAFTQSITDENFYLPKFFNDSFHLRQISVAKKLSNISLRWKDSDQFLLTWKTQNQCPPQKKIKNKARLKRADNSTETWSEQFRYGSLKRSAKTIEKIIIMV
jgi:hypothetical protein